MKVKDIGIAAGAGIGVNWLYNAVSTAQVSTVDLGTSVVKGLGLNGLYGFGANTNEILGCAVIISGFIVAPIIGTVIGTAIKKKGDKK